MAHTLRWVPRAEREYATLRDRAEAAAEGRRARGKTKTSKAEGLFKQVNKALRFLQENPQHPSLSSHEYHSLDHPFDKDGKVWESYIQNETPGAYRLFWCYGPTKGEITVIAITPHP
jgi:hypothetical protein